MTPGLKQAVRRLYRVFRKYKLRTALNEAYGSAIGPPIVTSLNALSPDELALPLDKLMTTRGTVEDLKHLLPRISELIALNSIGFIRLRGLGIGGLPRRVGTMAEA